MSRYPGPLLRFARPVGLGELAPGALSSTLWQASSRRSSTLVPSSQEQVSQLRGYAAEAHKAPVTNDGKKTLLQQIMPPLISLVPLTLRLARLTVQDAVRSGLQSGPARKAVTSLTDRVVISEALLPLTRLNLANWATWLSTAGYNNKVGWRKLAEAMKSKGLADMEADEVAAFAYALYTVNYQDKALLEMVASHVSEHFMEYNTESLVKLVHVFSELDHFSVELFDDLADGIIYCNHFMSIMDVNYKDSANVFKAFSKFRLDRGDLFVALARGINELKLMEMKDDDFAYTLMTLLKSFDALNFWPDCTEGLFVAAEKKASALSAGDQSELQNYISKVEKKFGGRLDWYRGGYKDPEHFHGDAYGTYNMWVFRDETVPESYKPTDIKAWK